MAASLLALVRGIAISIIIIYYASSYSIQLLCGKLAYTLAHGIVLHAPFGKQVSVSGEDYLCVAELCVSEL